jgi:hypothetical protein
MIVIRSKVCNERCLEQANRVGRKLYWQSTHRFGRIKGRIASVEKAIVSDTIYIQKHSINKNMITYQGKDKKLKNAKTALPRDAEFEPLRAILQGGDQALLKLLSTATEALDSEIGKNPDSVVQRVKPDAIYEAVLGKAQILEPWEDAFGGTERGRNLFGLVAWRYFFNHNSIWFAQPSETESGKRSWTYSAEPISRGKIRPTEEEDRINQGIKPVTKLSTKNIALFMSYSHKDQKLRDQLAQHLGILRNEGMLSGWHDRQIEVGKNWKEEIDKNLNSAQIVLLLISPDFLASDYCYGVEMTRALERHDKGEARVIPVIVRPCDWGEFPIRNLQVLPTDGRPVTTWRNRDSAFANIAINLKKMVDRLLNLSIAEKSSKYSLVLSANINDIDLEKLETILKRLREIAGDASITLRKVEKGSVVLYLEGTQETAEILKYLIGNGMLKEVCGCKVKGVGLSPDEPVIHEIDDVHDKKISMRSD